MDLIENRINIESLKALAKRYEICELALFGSILSEYFTESSDIDLLVTFSEASHYSYFELLQIKESFENLLSRPVDLVEKKSIRNPYKKSEILSTAKTIYAA